MRSWIVALAGGVIISFSFVLILTYLDSAEHDYQVTITTNSQGEFNYELIGLFIILLFGLGLTLSSMSAFGKGQ